MHVSSFYLPMVFGLACAHRDQPSLPKFMGGKSFLKSIGNQDLFQETRSPRLDSSHSRKTLVQLDSRQATRCGPGVGSCSAGYCCSAAGYCGQTPAYCNAPDCQFQYGPACDANKVPSGSSTSSISRTKVGSISYGGSNTGGVQDCINVAQMALTFDDGPYLYTKDLLDLLDRYNAKATFFITGINLGKGQIDDCSTGYPQLIQRMYESGHQIASHTWSHQNLSALTKTQFQNQIYYNEMAFRNILGQIPTYIRPPYSECNKTCSSLLSTLGYHATYFDLDTSDYLNDSPTLIQNSKDLFTSSVAEYGSDPSQSNFLVIGHDIHYQTVYNLTEYMLQSMRTSGYGTSVTVGTCLGDPKENWYRSAGMKSVTCSYIASPGSASGSASKTGSVSNTKASAISSTKTTALVASATSAKQSISTDGNCGGSVTCQGSTYGNCCSQYMYCGKTEDYCGAGCNRAFGSCT